MFSCKKKRGAAEKKTVHSLPKHVSILVTLHKRCEIVIPLQSLYAPDATAAASVAVGIATHQAAHTQRLKIVKATEGMPMTNGTVWWITPSWTLVLQWLAVSLARETPLCSLRSQAFALLNILDINTKRDG